MDVKELVKYGLLALAGWWVYNDFIAPNMATAAATGGGGVPAPPPVPDMPGAGAPAAPPPAPGSGQVIPPPAPAHQHHDTGTHAGGGLPAAVCRGPLPCTRGGRRLHEWFGGCMRAPLGRATCTP